MFDCYADTLDCRRSIRHCRLDLSKHVKDEKAFLDKYAELYRIEGKDPVAYNEICAMINLPELANKIAKSLSIEPSTFIVFGPHWSNLYLVDAEADLPRYTVGSDKTVSWLGPYAYVEEDNNSCLKQNSLEKTAVLH